MTVTVEEIVRASALVRDHERERQFFNARFVLASRFGKDARRSLTMPKIRRVILAALLARDGSTCSYCGDWFSIDLDGMIAPQTPEAAVGLAERVVIDHIRPVSKGGMALDFDNLQILHPVCNIRKSDRWPA